MKKALTYLIALTLALGIGSFLLTDEFAQKMLCETFRDGVWSTTRAQCRTSLCYIEGDCMLRAYPAAHCGAIQIGDHIGEVYLRLGMPVEISGDLHQWFAHKTDENIGVTAKFRNETLIALDCPAYPWADN